MFRRIKLYTICLLIVCTIDSTFGQCSSITELSYIPGNCSALTMTTIPDQMERPFLYVANKEAGLSIYNIADVTDPVFISDIPITLIGEMEVMSLTQEGNYLYLVGGNHWDEGFSAGLAIVDITSPFSPILLSHYLVPGTSHGGGVVKVEGNYAYLGAMRDGLVILDISDKTEIKLVSHVIPDINYPVANPANPKFYNARGLDVLNGIVFLCYDAGALRIYDCTDPSMPIEIGRYSNPDLQVPFNRPRAYNNIEVLDNLAYIAVDYCGMEILDISDPISIQLVGKWNPYNCPENNWFNTPVHANEISLDIDDQLAYLSTGKSDMYVVDINDPSNPTDCTHYGSVSDGVGTWGISYRKPHVFLTEVCVPFGVPFASKRTGIKILHSETISNGLEQTKLSAIVAPNPIMEFFSLKAPFRGKFTFVIYGIMGNELLRIQGVAENAINVDLRNIITQAGTYFYSFQTPNGTATGKVLIVPNFR